MFIRRRRDWEVSEREVTDRSIYLDRRSLLGVAGASLVSLSLLGCDSSESDGGVSSGGGVGGDSGGGVGGDVGVGGVDKLVELTSSYYPAERNDLYQVSERSLTGIDYATRYNNFYEFGSHKNVWQSAQALETYPWEVVIDGEVESELRMDFTELLSRMPLEQRIYRHRCVEAWAMTVPWDGFALRELVKLASPLSSAKYLRMETYADKSVMSGLQQFWYPWPYVEGLTLAEASNDLAFIATGMYGDIIPKQNGAPLRLAVPWKYGFKSLKSISRFTFTSERPVSFWEQLQSREYGFWANVNPSFPHPRWSQSSERLLGEDRRVATQIYNGYGSFVSDLYSGMDTSERTLFF